MWSLMNRRRKTKTNAERQAEAKASRRMMGHRLVSVWLDCQAQAILDDYIREQGCTQEAAINRLICN